MKAAKIPFPRKETFMNSRQAEILLFSVIAARSTSYTFSKISIHALPPLELLGIRFLLSSLLLCILFHRKLVRIGREEIKGGILTGLSLFACMACELVSLTMIPASSAAFLENTAVLWVILMGAFLKRKIPGLKTIFSMALVITGIGCLTLKGNEISFSAGELICLAGSIFYAVWILLTGHFAKRAEPISIGLLQMGVMGILGLAFSFLLEIPVPPAGLSTWASLSGLILLCSVFGFTFQTVAQKYASPEMAGFFAAAAPMMAAFFSWLILGEAMTWIQMAGAGLITVSLVLMQRSEKEKQEKEISLLSSGECTGKI